MSDPIVTHYRHVPDGGIMDTSDMISREAAIAACCDLAAEWADHAATVHLSDGADECAVRLRALPAADQSAALERIIADRVQAALAKEDAAHEITIKQRDRAEDAADKLARAIGGDAIGEHSSTNDPWANALRIAEDRTALAAQGEPVAWLSADAVSQAMEDDAGRWITCSGCYDTEDGHPTQRYGYSSVMQCSLGSGCFECGGIGAVWDTTDYAEMADWLAKELASDVDQSAHPAPASASCKCGQRRPFTIPTTPPPAWADGEGGEG